MLLMLVIGSVFAGERCSGIPPKLKELLTPRKLQEAVSVGDLGDQSELELLKTVASRFHAVRGESDPVVPNSAASALPEKEVFTTGRLRFGVIGAHNILPSGDADAMDATRRTMCVDVLCTTGTGRRGLIRSGGDGVIVDPGTASGAPSGDGSASQNPGFVILDIHGATLTCYTYTLEQDTIKVEKEAWMPEEDPGQQAV